MRRVGVVGAGWAGATCARVLHDAGVGVEIFEAAATVGGHSRMERLNGVLYEPEGPHVFHTDDPEVAAFVHRFGMGRPYRFEIRARVHPDDGDPLLLSWPPQVEELRRLAQWPTIERELEARPPAPRGESFEEYAISLMGETLYRLFVHGYTVKQWGCDPRELSSSFAPRRLDFRTDGDRRLFRDRWQYFEAEGVNHVIEAVAACAVVHAGVRLTLADLCEAGHEFDAWVVTAPLDEFVGRPGTLAWRGIESRARYVPLDDPGATVTESYVINHSDLRYPFTRTVETKHASGQQVLGTVVCEEHSGAPYRHYPVATVDGEHERRNAELAREVREVVPVPVELCGRLATYRYINQDEAIRQGIDSARRLLALLSERR